MDSFSIEEFVSECRTAVADDGHHGTAVREVVARTVNDGAIARALGDPRSLPLFDTWYRGDDLTVLHVVWPPTVHLVPHDHRMWAAIGLYGGREDNAFFTRTPDGHLEPRGDRTLLTGDSVALGADTIHAVANPGRAWTAAIHCYGGDYFGAPREMWAEKAASPEPFDVDALTRELEAAADRARGGDGSPD